MNYLIIGDDEYLRAREEGRLKEKFLSPEEIDLNYSVFSPVQIDEIIDSLNTVPFMGKRRVVIVKDAHQLTPPSVEALICYAEKPLDSTVLILSADSSLEDNKSYRKLSSLAETVKADKPEPATVKKWIRGFFKNEGIEISSRAVDLIAELKGDDTSGIKTELEKLAAYCAGGKIETQDVEELVGRSVTETVFKLVDAINEKNAKWTFRVIQDLYSQKKQPHEIIGYLAWYFRTLQKVIALSAETGNVGKIASGIKYSPAYTKRLMAQAKKYSAEKLEGWASLLLDTDLDIKTGRKPADLALETLITVFLTS